MSTPLQRGFTGELLKLASADDDSNPRLHGALRSGLFTAGLSAGVGAHHGLQTRGLASGESSLKAMGRGAKLGLKNNKVMIGLAALLGGVL